MSAPSGIGFIGFGEAGFNIALGLRQSGLSRVLGYDINTGAPGPGEKIRQRAEASGVELVTSPERLARECGVLFSTVTADQARTAAEQIAPYLGAGHLYVDLNSVSPASKQAIGAVVTARGARFVEAAVMGAVPKHGHRVPMLLGGKAADEFAKMFTGAGMRLEVVSDQVGAAIAAKMCRSIVIKGLEALLFECAMAATCYGADSHVFKSLDESYPGIEWEKLTGYMMSRVLEHGRRRAREMEEVVQMLRAAGVDPVMTEAASRVQEWGGRLELPGSSGVGSTEDYRELAEAVRQRVADSG
jgi:3-hydroxyisobutyrate dehydrogenase